LLDQEGKDARMAIANDIQQKVHIALGGSYFSFMFWMCD